MYRLLYYICNAHMKTILFLQITLITKVLKTGILTLKGDCQDALYG